MYTISCRMCRCLVGEGKRNQKMYIKKPQKNFNTNTSDGWGGRGKFHSADKSKYEKVKKVKKI